MPPYATRRRRVLLERLDELGLIEDHDGAKLVNLEKYKLGRAVLRKKGERSSMRFVCSTLC